MKKYIQKFYAMTDEMNMVQKSFVLILVFAFAYAISWVLIQICEGIDFDPWGSDDEEATIVLAVIFTVLIAIRVFKKLTNKEESSGTT
jgi:hypothetical protein